MGSSYGEFLFSSAFFGDFDGSLGLMLPKALVIP